MALFFTLVTVAQDRPFQMGVLDLTRTEVQAESKKKIELKHRRYVKGSDDDEQPWNLIQLSREIWTQSWVVNVNESWQN